MSNGHLIRNTNGHLLVNRTDGHLCLNRPTTYTLANIGGSRWGASNNDYDFFSGANNDQFEPTQVVAGVNKCVNDHALISSGIQNTADVLLVAIQETTAVSRSVGGIWEVTPQTGRSFNAPVAESLAIVVAKTAYPYQYPASLSGATIYFGTGDSIPTGDPRLWGGAYQFTEEGSSTLTNISLLRYIWLCAALSPWSGLSSDHPYPYTSETCGRGIYASLGTIGVISD